ncbi:hypothetical protein F6504_10580 [Listeria monocytogenes]|nr:hypothetical protein [Listeria monocytogenes]ECZ8707639.1 hypothetical protein [Listeria monocytogenes]
MFSLFFFISMESYTMSFLTIQLIANYENYYNWYEMRKKSVFSFWCVKRGGLCNESGNGEELSQI